MKRFKKFLAAVLTAATVMSMGLTAMAAGEAAQTGTITVKNTIKDTEYKVYQIFSLEGEDNSDLTKNVVYKVTDNFKSFINTYDGFKVNANGYVIENPLTESNVAAFAKAAVSYAKLNQIAASYTQTATENGGTIIFNSVELGYYALQAGNADDSVCSLDNANPDAVLIEKNQDFNVEKAVEDDYLDKLLKKTNDQNIGKTVRYAVKVEVPNRSDVTKFTFYDNLDDNLTYVEDSAKVYKTVNHIDSIIDNKIDDIVSADGVQEVSGLTVNAPGTVSGADFEIPFTVDSNFFEEDGMPETLIIVYEAKINKVTNIITSVVNEANVIFDNKPWHDSTTTYIYNFNIEKVDPDQNDKPLEGVEFALYADTIGDKKFDEANGNVEEIKVANADLLVSVVDLGNGLYRLAKDDEEGTTTLVTNSEGKITVFGFGSVGEKYHLLETKALAGYNLPAGSIDITIERKEQEANSHWTVTSAKNNATLNDGAALKIVNKTGSLLPSTGGIGTTIFYIVGGILILGAAIVFLAKRKAQD